ncbi:Protein BOBBER 2 [Glycine soja]
MRSGSLPPPYMRCLSFSFSPNPSTSDTVIFVDDSRSLVVSDTRVVDPFTAPNTLLSFELASLQWQLSLISTKSSRNPLTLHHRNPNLLPLHLRSVLLLTGHNDFLERFFEFVYKHNDFLATESTEKEIVSLVRVIEKKREFLKGEREKAKMKKKREDLKASEEREKSNKRLKEEKEPKVEDTNKDESASRVQNKGNGLDLEKYSWTQSLQEVNVNVPVPNGTKSRFVTVKIKNHLKVGFKGQPPIVEVSLSFNIIHYRKMYSMMLVIFS